MTIQKTIGIYSALLVLVGFAIWAVIEWGNRELEQKILEKNIAFGITEQLFEEQILIDILIENPSPEVFKQWQFKHQLVRKNVLDANKKHPLAFTETNYVKPFTIHHDNIEQHIVAYSNTLVAGSDVLPKNQVMSLVRNNMYQLLIPSVGAYNNASAQADKTIAQNRINFLLLTILFVFIVILFHLRVNNIFFKKVNTFINRLSYITDSDYELRFDPDDATELRRIKEAVNVLLGRIESGKFALEKTMRQLSDDRKKLKKALKQSEKTQKATLNILDDFTKEKEKLEQQIVETMKYKMAVAASNDHIIITDAEGVILYANKSVKRITGYSQEEVLGKKAGAKELWGGQMDKQFYKDLWNTIKFKKQVFAGEVKNKRKNGELYYAQVSISPVMDNDELVYFVGIERDISEEKAISNAKTEFVSLASHQLRTPLSTINWYSEMMLAGDAGKLNTDQKTYVEEIYTGSQRMVQLVNALLNVSRIELGTFVIDAELVDVCSIIDTVIEESEQGIKQKKIMIHKKYAQDIPEIKADVNLMRIIVQNIITNAVKYTPEKKGEITISVYTEKKQLVLEVIDNGLGIPLHQQDKIFTKLFRADNVKETDTQGTGLGLYITKSILEHVGGAISFVSEENKGTTFTITLPLSGMKNKKGTRTLNS